MADPVYKRITDLDAATLPLSAADESPISQSGTTKKVAESARYGTGWFAKLAAAFSAFKAPDADHADNADTLGTGEELPADFHDAAQLTGAIHLDRIPAELTGKNAATADLADVATLAHSCDGNAASSTVAPCGIVNGGSVPGNASQRYVLVIKFSDGTVVVFEAAGGTFISGGVTNMLWIRKS